MSLDNNCPGQLQVELGIKAMQPVLIPGLLAIRVAPVPLMDLGSVGPR